ncbi:pilus assembly PilX N-terminal domain-containing protein [Deinococcus koreensis]|uniref:Type 4 fimbrial biogenesis protein PilX N-terminal domain-containing protein n=1 Tax=Deinococcus koreensis TaxID=2054903 RepID=A0A2K3UXC9_9DEIO|nr:pilus assembly PilX N-terminal domain-containing protein [Deinococcus koreensis]PNY81165.1 hypothetical protein CVO96_07035 [Deinococcus koreensis]
MPTRTARPSPAPARTTAEHRAGYALISVMIAMMVLSALAIAYISITLGNQRDTSNVANSLTGFYAAEGGLNIRAEKVRGKFVDYSRPAGSSPATATPCQGSNVGSGDFACDTSLTLAQRQVATYVLDTTDPDPAKNIGVVNPGETYAGLNYQQYSYRVVSEAQRQGSPDTEARLQMEFQSRLVPMFQFAAFYKNDLEINPSPAMTLNGRVHTNSDLYLSPSTSLKIGGRITTGGDIFRKRKESGGCDAGPVTVSDTASTTKTMQGCSSALVPDSNFTQFNGRVKTRLDSLTVPKQPLSPVPGEELFSKADLRIVARRDSAGVWLLEARNADGLLNTAATSRLKNAPDCAGALSMNPASGAGTGTFNNRREEARQTLIEVNQRLLMNCIHTAPAGTFLNPAGNTLKLDDTTGNGLVWNFSFQDADAAKTQSNLGVRVTDAATLGSGLAGAPAVKGLTIVTDQAAYLQGDFNKIGWKPASVLADTVNVLSNSWSDSAGTHTASDTEVNAAFLAGTDITAGGKYNGGLENYPRFHEDWSGKTFRYRGSFVSLDQPAHASGAWGKAGVYSPPRRDWDYDSRYDNAANLPPLAPRFVYLRQLLFARNF